MSTLWKSSSKQSNQGFRTKEVSIQSADLWFEKVRKGEIVEILSTNRPKSLFWKRGDRIPDSRG